MGFFNDIGKGFKRTFANPTKLIADISTFGTTAILRTLPKSIGGGQSGIFSKGSEVYGATAIGVGVGFATGGPAGAAVGGASGFGRGVSGVLHKESGKNIAGGAAKWSAITGSVTGAAKGIILARSGISATVGNSGIVGKGANTVYASIASKSLASSAVAPVATASKAGSFGELGSLGTLAVFKLLQGNTLIPSAGAGSTGVTLNSAGPGTPTSTPSNGPNLYPGVPSGLQTVDTGIAGLAVAPRTNWLLYGSVALLAVLLLAKKKHG